MINFSFRPKRLLKYFLLHVLISGLFIQEYVRFVQNFINSKNQTDLESPRFVMFSAVRLFMLILTCDTCDGFRDYSQGDHGWPPPKVDFSLSPSSHLVTCGAAWWAMSSRLFESALLQAVYPGIWGSSGTVERCLSNFPLKTSVEQFVVFLTEDGKFY